MSLSTLYDVAIVGFGPSGAVAAALLGQAGLSVLVCDRQHDVYDKPRAVALDHEIMRVFQQIGITAELEPFIEPFTPSEYFGVDGQLIRRMTMVAPPYPQGYTPSMVFSQPPLEQILRSRVAALSNVDVRLGLALRALHPEPDFVTLQFSGENSDSAGVAQVRARYVIGCDGASSTVRRLTGIELEDLDFDEQWLVADVLVNARGLQKLPTTSVQYCEPGRPCSLIIGPKNHRRWEISLNPGEDPQQAATPEGTWKLLSRWLTPQDGELWRQASYRFHALVAHDWRRGRVFIAGDAAHQQPPFLGQGMCQGIRDVANLSWKLAAVLGGNGGGNGGANSGANGGGNGSSGIGGQAVQALLDSYGIERREHVRELTSRIKHIGEMIGERDIVRARARDAKALADCGGVVPDTPRQDVMPVLSGGFLSASCGSGRGSLFPQPRIVAAGHTAELMDQCFGHGWRLVLLDGLGWLNRPATGAVTTIRLGGDEAKESDGIVAAWMTRHACRAALLRPDHYVFGTAASQRELDALLAELAAIGAA